MVAKMGRAGRVDKLITVQGNNPFGPAHERLPGERRCQNLLYLGLASVSGHQNVESLGVKARKYLRGAVG